MYEKLIFNFFVVIPYQLSPFPSCVDLHRPVFCVLFPLAVNDRHVLLVIVTC